PGEVYVMYNDNDNEKYIFQVIKVNIYGINNSIVVSGLLTIGDKKEYDKSATITSIYSKLRFPDDEELKMFWKCKNCGMVI
ncbi:MAG: hypothetical protein KC550_04900, partial [Nanoarchaeota archaeon]|nr:hypothetical protein [Nanoarchaeota archaeon]